MPVIPFAMDFSGGAWIFGLAIVIFLIGYGLTRASGRV